ncbi:MAG: nucleotidyltransferase family protein [Promethearchaeota archaeon]|nr:MAG: nucleotidyltransferase family protein [Candidatus Lokiarchaeota archaeon]
MKAIVLCAGYGKRLRPYTDKLQKSMIPIHGKPLLEYIINGLISANLRDLILVVGYKKEQIINHFGNGENWNIKLDYVEQKDLNGTGGAVLLCENFIRNSHFFVTYGDVLLTNRIYTQIYKVFKKEHHDFVLVANYTEDPSKGGSITCEGKYCVNILEKPKKETPHSNLNNAGVFIFSQEIFDVLKSLKPTERGEIELPDAINLGILKRKWKVRVIEMAKEDFRGDFGDIEVYERLKNETHWLNELKI